jgi:TetR/AcrR family transcriptional repressor of nem operon
VEPALAILHSEEDGLTAIDAYFAHFIDKHSQHGMPGPGCFLAYSMTGLAPHHEAVRVESTSPGEQAVCANPLPAGTGETLKTPLARLCVFPEAKAAVCEGRFPARRLHISLNINPCVESSAPGVRTQQAVVSTVPSLPTMTK